jgi:hypothetical protein
MSANPGGGVQGRKALAAAIVFLSAPALCLGAPPTAAAADTASRVEVPISQLRLSDGTIRYWVPIKVGRDGPIEAMLDTGSFGLRVMAGALSPADYQDTGEQRNYSYGSGVELHGELVKAVVQIGERSTGVPVVIQLVQSVGCKAERPVCPASKVSPEDYRIGGDGLPREGFWAILGLSMRVPQTSPAALNPLVEAGDHAWIVVLPLRNDTAPGKLIINPSAEDRAGFQLIPVPQQIGSDDRPRMRDSQLPACLDEDDPKLGSCPPVKLDSGDNEGVRPYFLFAVLYDEKGGMIGIKPRRDVIR